MAVFLIREPRCVFIHVPKTGGASIRHGFFKGNVDGPKQGFVPDVWQSLYKFAFVRNPYDRVISAWKMFATGMEHSVWEHPGDCQGIGLERFLEIATDESIPFDGNRKHTAEKIRHHAIPQTHPFNCVQHADFVGRFETLTEDFEKVCVQIGLKDAELPHWNQSTRATNFMSYFSDETKRIVEEFYREDFTRFGYDFVESTN